MVPACLKSSTFFRTERETLEVAALSGRLGSVKIRASTYGGLLLAAFRG